MNIGFVYILANPSMPGLYKIGFTMRHPLARMAELSAGTSCATPFEMAGYFDCVDPAQVERAMHCRLSAYRVNPAREFFRAPVHLLQDLTRDYGNPEGVWCFDLLDHLCTHHVFEEEAA